MFKGTNDMQKKLKYLNLDLNKLPECLLKPVDININPARNYEEKKYRVYKYVPISKINILLTRANRMNSLHEKCEMSAPLYSFLVPENEEGILRHTIFLKMIQDMNIDEIKEIEEEQEKFRKEIPYKVKYKENYLWQIYYSEYTKSYWMLAPIEDQDYSCLFYLIKQKIEYAKSKNDKDIFVPVSYLDYSKMYLTKSQVADVEKYIWQFTKEWPLIYEVYDRNENMSFQIIGNTEVYDKINSIYKISLESSEEATKFYKLIKALFILETEFPSRYNFEAKISENGSLEFIYNSKIIDYDNLMKFIKEEYLKNKQESEALNEEIIQLNNRLDKLKLIAKDKEEEYHMRQKQITMYLECKKSFFGKIRYFFKGKKYYEKQKKKREIDDVKDVEKKEALEIINNTKEYYTIEDLADITRILDRIGLQIKNTNMDIKAYEETIERLTKKINNARRYIEEIEEHKKSIFEFWSFVNKDNMIRIR